MLNATDTKITELLQAWHDNDKRYGGYKANPELADQFNAKHVVDGTKYLKLNSGSSGHFMVNRETEMVFSIKGYGTPNLKKPRGTVEFLTKFIRFCTTKGIAYQQAFWYDLHQINLICGKCGKGATTDHPADCDGTAEYDLKRYPSRSTEAAFIIDRAMQQKPS